MTRIIATLHDQGQAHTVRVRGEQTQVKTGREGLVVSKHSGIITIRDRGKFVNLSVEKALEGPVVVESSVAPGYAACIDFNRESRRKV